MVILGLRFLTCVLNVDYFETGVLHVLHPDHQHAPANVSVITGMESASLGVTFLECKSAGLVFM